MYSSTCTCPTSGSAVIGPSGATRRPRVSLKSLSALLLIGNAQNCKRACSFAHILDVMISADDLGYFLEVARTGKLVAAAQGLGVDHTTVGRRLTRLERATGSRLFDRSTGRWRLTEAGERLRIHAESVESALAAAAEELRSTPGRLSGTLRITAPDGFGAFVLSPGLGRLRRKHRESRLNSSRPLGSTSSTPRSSMWASR